MSIREFLFKNTSTKQTVVKNTFWLTFGQIGSRTIKAIIIIYAARVLGATEWGAFSYALSLAAFFTIFTDFGVSSVVTREASKDITIQEKYFSTAMVIKTIMTIALIAIIFLITPLLTKDAGVRILLPIIIILISLDGFRDFGASLSRAWEKMEIDAFIQIFTNLAIVAGGFIALYFMPSAKSLTIGYTAGVGLGMIAAFLPFRHYFHNFKKNFSRRLIKKILYSSWPIGLSGLMGVAMLNTDTIMIGWFRDVTNVGYYSSGIRVIQLIYLIPVVITTAFFPSLAKASEQKERFQNIITRSLVLLTLFSIPLTIGGFLLSEQIIEFLFGAEYLPAVTSFQILNLTYIVMFLSGTLGNALFVLNKEKNLFIFSTLGFFGNFAFNLLLIPALGITGSAISTVITQILTTFYLFYQLKKDIKFNLTRKLSKIALAALCMGIIVILLNALSLNVIFTIAVAAIAYFAILFFLKEETVLEIKELFARKVL